MKKIIFVVEMLRNNDREQHSYVCGVFDDEMQALTEAWTHMKWRAGKYGAEVSGHELNGGAINYFRKLDCWDAFAASCADTAAKIKEVLDKEQIENGK